MKIVSDIKNSIGSLFMQRGLEKGRRAVFPTFTKVQDIGIVYNAGNQKEEAALQQFANELRDQGKKVFMLGYVDAKQLPHSKKFHISSEFFWKEKLNLVNLPDPVKIGRFLDIRFDVLLNIHFDELLPLKGVAALSKAKYRVGPNLRNGLNLFDCIVDTGSNHDVYNLAKQMEHYLKAVSC